MVYLDVLPSHILLGLLTSKWYLAIGYSCCKFHFIIKCCIKACHLILWAGIWSCINLLAVKLHRGIVTLHWHIALELWLCINCIVFYHCTNKMRFKAHCMTLRFSIYKHVISFLSVQCYPATHVSWCMVWRIILRLFMSRHYIIYIYMYVCLCACVRVISWKAHGVRSCRVASHQTNKYLYVNSKQNISYNVLLNQTPSDAFLGCYPYNINPNLISWCHEIRAKWNGNLWHRIFQQDSVVWNILPHSSKNTVSTRISNISYHISQIKSYFVSRCIFQCYTIWRQIKSYEAT